MSETKEPTYSGGDMFFSMFIIGIIAFFFGCGVGYASESHRSACRTAFHAARTAADTLMVYQDTECYLDRSRAK